MWHIIQPWLLFSAVTALVRVLPPKLTGQTVAMLRICGTSLLYGALFTAVLFASVWLVLAHDLTSDVVVSTLLTFLLIWAGADTVRWARRWRSTATGVAGLANGEHLHYLRGWPKRTRYVHATDVCWCNPDRAEPCPSCGELLRPGQTVRHYAERHRTSSPLDRLRNTTPNGDPS